MLTNIIIQNIVLIERLSIDFQGGLCVLSGETGSGKSILLDSLGLTIGNRSNSRLLRKGCKQGLAIAQFNISNNETCQEILKNNGLEDSQNPNNISLKRVLFDNLTSKAFVNDIPVSLNLLSQIGDSLVEIHGQNEQRWLLNNSYHRQILDQFANNNELVKQTALNYQNWHAVEEKLKILAQKKDKNEREIDYLSHIIKELEAAKIKAGEEDSLIQKRSFLNNKEKITSLIAQADKNINDADTKLGTTQNDLIKNQNLSETLSEDLKSDFTKAIDLIDEVLVKNNQIRSLIDNISSDLTSEDSLEEIEERLFLIRNLSRKFNKTADELEAFLTNSQEELNNILNYRVVSEDLEKDKIQLKAQYLKIAQELSNSRKEASLRLSTKTEAELLYLKMGNVNFLAKIDDLEEENYSINGINSVRFLAKINQNSDFDQISKIASGGELSRFMLAIKVSLLNVKSVPILIFDEIDSGIGGAVANAVGERLKLLSSNLQVMVVTHHAQVAAKSNHHLRVKKEDLGDKTNTIVEILNEDEKKNEVARMLSGENISNEAILAAQQLMGG